MPKQSRALIVYKDALFRDCVSAILEGGGWTELSALEMDEFRPELIGRADAVIVEVGEQAAASWQRAVQPVLRRDQLPDRLLVVGVSFTEDRAHVLLSQRIGGATSRHLLGLLEAWSVDSDR